MNTTRDFAAERKVIASQLEAALENRSNDEEAIDIAHTFFAKMDALGIEEREVHEAGKRKVLTAAEAESLINWTLIDVDLEALTAGGRDYWEIRRTVLKMVEEANDILLFDEAYLYFIQNFPNRYGSYDVIHLNEEDIAPQHNETFLEAEIFMTHWILMGMGREE